VKQIHSEKSASHHAEINNKRDNAPGDKFMQQLTSKKSVVIF
jgi:hypothetical protein